VKPTVAAQIFSHFDIPFLIDEIRITFYYVVVLNLVHSHAFLCTDFFIDEISYKLTEIFYSSLSIHQSEFSWTCS